MVLICVFILMGMSMFTKDLEEVVNHIFKEYDFQSKPDSRATLKDTCFCLLKPVCSSESLYPSHKHWSLSLDRVLAPGFSVNNLAHLPPISGYIHTFSLLSQEYLAIISLQGLALLPPIHLAKDYSSLNVKLTPVQFYQRILISQCQTHTSSILHSKRVEAMSVFFLIVYPVSGI